MATVINSAICSALLSNNSYFDAKVTHFLGKQSKYQIKFCIFALVNQKNVNMNRIKEVLTTKGISQTELANMLGKTFNMVNLYTTNRVQLPISILYRIAEILNVDVRTLLVPNEIKKIDIWQIRI